MSKLFEFSKQVAKFLDGFYANISLLTLNLLLSVHIEVLQQLCVKSDLNEYLNDIFNKDLGFNGIPKL